MRRLTLSGLLKVEHLPANFGEASTRTAAPHGAEDGGTPLHRAATPAPLDDSRSVNVPVGTTVDEAERRLILKTLESTHNNKTRAAEILGITTKTLQNKLKEYASADSTAAE